MGKRADAIFVDGASPAHHEWRPMSSPIFITARFRTGSTLLWNMFRQVPGMVAYYEPDHPHLIGMIRRRTPPQRTHHRVEEYFREYQPLPDLAEHHPSEFGASRLFLEQGDEAPALQAYIQYLIDRVVPEKTAFLQFNRLDFRLSWVRSRFPEARIVHLFRSPREQWLSSIAGYEGDVDADADSDPYLMATWARDLCRQFPFLAGDFIRHAYQRHYYLWKLSYLLGSRLSDYSFSYESLMADPRRTAAELLQVSGVWSEVNVDSALSVLVEAPMQREDETREEWYGDLEQECEGVLTELGLNQELGLRPLDEIISRSARYQELLADPKTLAWVARNGQREIFRLQEVCDGKEEFIQTQDRLVREQSAHQAEVIGLQAEQIAQRTEQIARYNEQIAQYLVQIAEYEARLESQVNQLHAMNEAIQDLLLLRRTSLRYRLLRQPHAFVKELLDLESVPSDR